MFAIITFRRSGPIKSWSAMQAANVHNARLKPLPHAVPGAPAPMHLIGSGDLVADVRAILRDASIDADRLRKNGVIAYEAVLTASPEFFEQGEEKERQARLEAWIKAQHDWAVRRYGTGRIASLVVHLDEKTPHAHLVVVPLEMKVDKRRREERATFSIVGRYISGPGAFDEVQDAYAEAMAPFGLRRGERRSGRKNEPVVDYLKRLDDHEAEVARREEHVARREAEAAAREAEAKRMAREADVRVRGLDEYRNSLNLRAADERQKLREERAEIDRLKQDQARRLAAEEERLRERSWQLERMRHMADARAAKLEELTVQLRPVVERANLFVSRAKGIQVADFPPRIGQAVEAARSLQKEVEAIVSAQRSAPSAAAVLQHLASLGR